jgi:hypothetical protein
MENEELLIRRYAAGDRNFAGINLRHAYLNEAVSVSGVSKIHLDHGSFLIY